MRTGLVPVADKDEDRPRHRGWGPWLVFGAFVATLGLQLVLMITAPPHVGLVVLVLAMGAAVVFAGLGNPTVAVSLLLVSAFLRLALPNVGLPDMFVLAFAGVLGAAAIAIARRVNRLPRLGALEAVMMLYVAWCIGSALAPHAYPATVPSTGEEFAVWRFILTGALMPFVLYIVGRFLFDRESAVRWLLWVILGLAAYSSLVSVLQFYAPGLVWPRYIVNAALWEGRAVGVFNQPVMNGLVIVFGFALALFLAGHASEPWWRRVGAAGVAVASIPAVYLTHTRVVWLVFGLVLVAGVLWARNFRAGFAVTLGVAVLGVAANWSNLTSADRSAGGVGSTNEVDDRLNMAATSIAAIEDKPLHGWGIGRFTQLNTYQHKQWSPGIDWERGYGLAAHHTELAITAELGAVGLVLWLAILVLLVHRLVFALRALPDGGLCGRGLALVAVFAFACWLITGQTVDLRFFDYVNMLVLLLAGLAVGWAERVAPAGRESG